MEILSINGGYFVLHPDVIDRIADDTTSWEADPLMSLAEDGQLTAINMKAFGNQWILYVKKLSK